MTKSKQPRQKHVPMRTCIATGERRAKTELLRLVLTENGDIEIDLTGKLKGRGANILPTLEALELAIKKNSLVRALKIEGGLKYEQLNSLRDKFAQAIEEKSFRPKNKPVTIRINKKDLT